MAACVKHYAANNQETNRDYVDVQIDERALREIYLPAFKAAVTEAKAFTMMGAYNKFRGEYLCENSHMLNDVLRDEWGFEGIVISDWAAVHTSVNSLKSGLDVEMGTPKPFNEFFLADPLIDSVKAGKISEAEIDKHVKRILQLMYTLKTMEGIRRVHGKPKRKAKALRLEHIAQMINYLQQLPDSQKKRRDIAIILTGFFGAFRRSELVSVKVEDLTWEPEGLIIHLPKSKTDQSGQGLLRALPYAEYEAVCPSNN